MKNNPDERFKGSCICEDQDRTEWYPFSPRGNDMYYLRCRVCGYYWSADDMEKQKAILKHHLKIYAAIQSCIQDKDFSGASDISKVLGKSIKRNMTNEWSKQNDQRGSDKEALSQPSECTGMLHPGERFLRSFGDIQKTE